jgi:hypothetical protein
MICENDLLLTAYLRMMIDIPPLEFIPVKFVTFLLLIIHLIFIIMRKSGIVAISQPIDSKTKKVISYDEATKAVNAKDSKVGRVITLDDGTAMFRSEGQFRQDCVNSGIDPKQFHKLLDGKVMGNYEWHKAGSTFIATEQSTEVKAGHAKVGDPLQRISDGYYVDGFLTFTVCLDERIARNHAEMLLELKSVLQPA